MFITWNDYTDLLEVYSKIYLDNIFYTSLNNVLTHYGFSKKTVGRHVTSIFRYKDLIILDYFCFKVEGNHQEIHFIDLNKCELKNKKIGD